MKQRVLFLCTHNSARSQMAQGLLNWLAPETLTALSAGTHPAQQHPLAAKVMAELGINILPQDVHALTDYVGQSFDLVVTVCDQAAEKCPIFPGNSQCLHWSFPDPAAETGSHAERLQAFRTARDGLCFQFWLWITEHLPADDEEVRPERAEEQH